MKFLAGSQLELITQTSTDPPPDVRAAMSIAAKEETPDTQSSQAFDIILSNIGMAVDDSGHGGGDAT
jgi:fumarate hydratase class I